MTSPDDPPRTTPGRLLVLTVVCGALLTILTIAFVDGPSQAPGFLQVVALHDAMIPRQTARPTLPARAEDPPVLSGRMDARDQGLVIRTASYAWRGRWVSLHLIDRPLDPPPEARTVRAGEPELMSFELGDLTLVCVPLRRQTLVAVGSGDTDSLVALTDRALSERLPPLSGAESPGAR